MVTSGARSGALPGQHSSQTADRRAEAGNVNNALAERLPVSIDVVFCEAALGPLRSSHRGIRASMILLAGWLKSLYLMLLETGNETSVPESAKHSVLQAFPGPFSYLSPRSISVLSFTRVQNKYPCSAPGERLTKTGIRLVFVRSNRLTGRNLHPHPGPTPSTALVRNLTAEHLDTLFERA